LSEEGNQGGNRQPQQALDEEKHESPETHFPNPVLNFHGYSELRSLKDTMTIKKRQARGLPIGDCQLPIANFDWLVALQTNPQSAIGNLFQAAFRR
jgi:hypothetical protein